MKVTEILGDSVREDLNFVADKIKDLPKNKSVVFVGEDLGTIPKIKEAPAFSQIEIDTKNEDRYKIIFVGFSPRKSLNSKIVPRKNPEIYFILSKNLEKFKHFDYIFLIDLKKFEKAKEIAQEKVFLLTSRKNQTKELEEIHENEEDLEIIQLGLPESWIDF